MALVNNKFFKATQLTLSSGEVAASTLTRSFTDRIDDIGTVSVYYNGQLIETIDDNPDGKFYYSVDTSAYIITNSTALVTGNYYKIKVPGSTVWSGAGASSNAAGTLFIASGTAVGSGTAEDVTSATPTTDITVTTNPDYTAPGYATETEGATPHSEITLLITDNITVSYYFDIYTEV